MGSDPQSYLQAMEDIAHAPCRARIERLEGLIADAVSSLTDPPGNDCDLRRDAWGVAFDASDKRIRTALGYLRSGKPLDIATVGRSRTVPVPDEGPKTPRRTGWIFAFLNYLQTKGIIPLTDLRFWCALGWLLAAVSTSILWMVSQ